MSHPITHHPDGATLMSYAAATLAEPLAAVVACHVSMCRDCRTAVADLERMGAALLLSTPRNAGERPLTLRRRPESAISSVSRHVSRSDECLPGPLVAAYDLTKEKIPWRRIGPGVWHHRLALRQEGEGDLRLLRISPGRRMPDHGHGGAELTLMLDGSYSDTTGEYRRGDVQDVDEEVEHQPVVGTKVDCICLIASVHPARFKSLVGRITQPWTGL